MRTQNSVKNLLASFVMSIVVLVVGFIVQRVFIKTLGLEYLGINGLFTNIVTMLGIVELGLGSAIVYHFYRPLAKRDKKRVKSLLHFYKLGYRIVAATVAVIGLLLMPFVPAIVGEVAISIDLVSVYALFLLDVVFSYLLTYKRSILYADQKSYLVNIAHLTSLLVMNGLQIAALLITGNFYLYLIIKIAMRVAENLIISSLVNKRYGYLTEGKARPIDAETKQDIFKKIKALFMHKIGALLVLGSDNIIIAIFLGVTTVGLYGNYYLVAAAIGMIVGQAFTAITASVGNLLITSSSKKSYAVYNNVRFANFWLATFAATGMLVAMDSFVEVWLGSGYILATSVLIVISINLYLQLTRSVTSSFKEAAGIFHEDRYVPLIESVVNIVLAILFMHIFGLAGVIMGTICSTLIVHLFSYPKYVYTKLFKRTYANYYFEFVRSLIVAVVIGTATFGLSHAVTVHGAVLQLAINIAIVLIVPNVILYTIFRNSNELKYFKQLILDIVNKKRRPVLREARPQNPIDC